jgi:hypothetical protein
MKYKILFTVILLIQVIISIHGIAQNKIPDGWKNSIYGNWKLDSLVTNNKRLTGDEKPKLENGFVTFFKDGTAILGDSAHYQRLNYEIFENEHHRIIASGSMNVQITNLDHEKMELTLNSPEYIIGHPEKFSLFLSRNNHSLMFNSEKVAGYWLETDHHFNTGGRNNGNVLILNKDHSVKVHFVNKEDSGTWSMDKNSLALDLKLSTGNYRSLIYKLGGDYYYSTLNLTDPFNNDSLVYLMNASGKEEIYQNDTIRSMPADTSKIFIGDSTAMRTRERITEYDPEAEARNFFQKKWKIQKMNDSLPVKSIFVLFLPDGKCVFTINNHKHKGIYRIKPSRGNVIFNFGNRDVLARYTMNFDFYGYAEGVLALEMVLPGDNKAGDYVFVPEQ